MQHNRVKPDAIEEAEAVSKLVQLVEDRATNLDDGKFGGVGRVGRG